MSEEYLPRDLHDEYARRMEDEHRRINRRLEGLETAVDQINTLAISVHSLAESVERMCTEQERQGQRLSALEGRDGEKWRAIIKYVGTAIAGVLIGYVASRLGLS